MAITDRERARVVRLIQSKQADDLPEGPFLTGFDPLAVAEGLEVEAHRAMLLFDVPKVDLRMDAGDALSLAAWLRQAPGRGA